VQVEMLSEVSEEDLITRKIRVSSGPVRFHVPLPMCCSAFCLRAVEAYL
jgi:hypothetical protein